MNVTRKEATITNTDEAFPGSFEVVLSTPSKDRDGDELATEDWKQPLPEHITFDVDHGMSVEKTVGSGTPSIEDGKLVVRGTYSSLDRAQEVRTLVKEGHIRTTSVAFMTEKVTKDGKTKSVRELLNGAFVAIPANNEAVVLSAKSGTKPDSNVQAAHDALKAAGAACAPTDDDHLAGQAEVAGKSLVRMVATKAVAGSYEQREQAIADALSSRYPGDDMWAYSIATFDDSVVYRVSGGSDLRGQWQADYTYDEGSVALGEPTRVNLVEQVVPMKSFTKSVAAAADVEPAEVLAAIDPVLDEETEETTPLSTEKSADADALDLQYRAMTAQVNAFTA